ncbi:hypothetical protein SKAU_G00372320 [Synaphobranchus kaupii]|uniref:Uncharacterized protein n=1 Tax=Synaphobranchus kaupii TaxID=118154 RepID=A0A9Q1IG36_SYNKA|nr:hypothetical protein SKAU_G00372320 [Synaphobranchus kaupii]
MSGPVKPLFLSSQRAAAILGASSRHLRAHNGNTASRSAGRPERDALQPVEWLVGLWGRALLSGEQSGSVQPCTGAVAREQEKEEEEVEEEEAVVSDGADYRGPLVPLRRAVPSERDSSALEGGVVIYELLAPVSGSAGTGPGWADPPEKREQEKTQQLLWRLSTALELQERDKRRVFCRLFATQGAFVICLRAWAALGRLPDLEEMAVSASGQFGFDHIAARRLP